MCERAYALSKEHRIDRVVVSDKAAVLACRRLLEDQRMLVEPACGAALALAYENSPTLASFNTVLVVCGGVTASAQQRHRWSEAHATRSGNC